jgi:hypothetical protein
MILEAIDLQLETNKQEQIHLDSNLTIEHIYPQTPDNAVWLPLENPILVHSIGNLTLLTSALNSSVSNGPFVNKRPEIAKQSRLRMNTYFQDLTGMEQWTQADILQRAQQLFELALAIWPRPALPGSVRLTPGQQRAIDSLCDIADQNDVGPAFRALLDVGLRHSFYPRTEPSSIMYAPQENKNRALYTAWVTPKDGFLKVYVATDTFAEFFGVGNDVAYQHLGSPGWRMMSIVDAEAFTQALDALLGAATGQA